MVYEDFYDIDLYVRKLLSDALYRDEGGHSALIRYFNSLTDEEKEKFEGKARIIYESVQIFGYKNLKITKSAVLLADKIKKDTGHACFPIIETVARKGWSTADGTFAWSMSLLESTGDTSDIYSYDRASICLSKSKNLKIARRKSFLIVEAVDNETEDDD